MKYINTCIAVFALSGVCAFAQIPIKIKQIESNEQVKIGYDSTEAYIWGIQIPFEVEVCFNGNDSLWISGTSAYVKEEFAGKGFGEGWKSVPLTNQTG